MSHRPRGPGSTILRIRAISAILQLHAHYFQRDRQLSTGKEIWRDIRVEVTL